MTQLSGSVNLEFDLNRLADRLADKIADKILTRLHEAAQQATDLNSSPAASAHYDREDPIPADGTGRPWHGPRYSDDEQQEGATR